MKKVLVFSTLIFLMCTHVVAQDLTIITETDSPQQIFNRANYLMDNGQYAEAMKMYRHIENEGLASGPLFANMAFISIRKDSLGLAKYYLLKSAQYPQTRTRATETLEFVENALQSRSGTLPVLPMYAFQEWLRVDVGVKTLLICAIVLLHVSALLLALYWIRQRWRRPLLISVAIAGLFGMLFLLTAVYLNNTRDDYSKAVVISRETTVYSDRDTTSEPVGLAYEGFTITLDHKQGASHPGWIHIHMSNGLSGWMQQRHIREL